MGSIPVRVTTHESPGWLYKAVREFFFLYENRIVHCLYIILNYAPEPKFSAFAIASEALACEFSIIWQ